MLAHAEKPDLEGIIQWLQSDDEKAWVYYRGIAEQMVSERRLIDLGTEGDVRKKTEPLYRSDKPFSRSVEPPVYDPDHEQALAAMPHLECLVRAMKNHIRQAALKSALAALDCMK